MAMSQLTISYEERIADIVQYLYSWGGSVLVQVRHINLMKLEVGINIAFNNIELLYNFRAYTYVICMWRSIILINDIPEALKSLIHTKFQNSFFHRLTL